MRNQRILQLLLHIKEFIDTHILFFGINTASEIFQRAIEDTLAGCEGQFNISDDIFVFGKDQAEHDKRLNNVLLQLFERSQF